MKPSDYITLNEAAWVLDRTLVWLTISPKSSLNRDKLVKYKPRNGRPGLAMTIKDFKAMGFDEIKKINIKQICEMITASRKEKGLDEKLTIIK
jgi:hypothetical protein